MKVVFKDDVVETRGVFAKVDEVVTVGETFMLKFPFEHFMVTVLSVSEDGNEAVVAPFTFRVVRSEGYEREL